MTDAGKQGLGQAGVDTRANLVLRGKVQEFLRYSHPQDGMRRDVIQFFSPITR